MSWTSRRLALVALVGVVPGEHPLAFFSGSPPEGSPRMACSRRASAPGAGRRRCCRRRRGSVKKINRARPSRRPCGVITRPPMPDAGRHRRGIRPGCGAAGIACPQRGPSGSPARRSRGGSDRRSSQACAGRRRRTAQGAPHRRADTRSKAPVQAVRRPSRRLAGHDSPWRARRARSNRPGSPAA